MKKNNRQQYLKIWLTYLKGKKQVDPKALADFLGKNLKGALSPTTMKRYTATVIANLYENGFLAGKTGKTFSGTPLEIVQEISLPILDKSLTQNYKKVKFTGTDQAAEPVKQAAETPASKKPRKIAAKKEIVVKARKTLGRKPAVKKPGLIGRKTDLLKMGEGAFLYSLELTNRVEEMEREIAGYQRVFEAIRELFSREMDEMEEWLGELLI